MIGDVNSKARGTGARFNDGKVPIQFIPAATLVQLYEQTSNILDLVDPVRDRALMREVPQARAYLVLCAIADFEERSKDDDVSLSQALRFSIEDQGLVGVERWRGPAAVFAYGAEKYLPWNWARGMPWSVVLASLKRHAVAVLENELNDEESGLPHLGHVAANVIMLLHYIRFYREGDDRMPEEAFGDSEEQQEEATTLQIPGPRGVDADSVCAGCSTIGLPPANAGGTD